MSEQKLKPSKIIKRRNITMSKVIVEIKMPCNIQYLAGLHGTPTCPIERRICKDGNNPPKWCPIKGVLPEEHGDLIDRDALKKRCWHDDGFDLWVSHIEIDQEPTVIAAERKESV